ncbi:MAG: hypothetical protein ACRC3B_01820 [Bacteroidia bacterium]
MKNYIIQNWRLIVLLTMILLVLITGGAALINGAARYWGGGEGGHGIAEAILSAALLWFTFNWYKLHKGKDW